MMDDLSNPEETPVTKIDRFKNGTKTFVEENKTACIVGVIAATNVATLLLARRFAPTVINNVVAPVITPMFNNINTVNYGGHLVKLVQCLETGEIWGMVTEAAEATGVPIATMSRHLHGHIDNLNDLHFKFIGIGTTGAV